MELRVDRETRRLTQGETAVLAETAIPALSGEGRGVERINRFYLRVAEEWFARCGVLAAKLPPGRYYASLCCTAEAGEREITVRAHLRLCFRGRPLTEEKWNHRWRMPRGLLLLEEGKESTKSKKRKVLP